MLTFGRRKLGSFRGVGIEADHPPSALDKVAGDRASHDAKPDDSNGLVHANSFSLPNLIDGHRAPRLNK